MENLDANSATTTRRKKEKARTTQTQRGSATRRFVRRRQKGITRNEAIHRLATRSTERYLKKEIQKHQIRTPAGHGRVSNDIQRD